MSTKRLVRYFQGQGHSKGSYDQNTSFYCIFLIADPFATKLGLMVHYHKPEFLMKKIRLLCSRSKSQHNFNVSSELLILLLPNLVWLCVIMTQSVFQKDWFALFKFKVTVKDLIIKV